MILGFIIWTIVSLIFLSIGISCRKAKEAVGFYTFSKAPSVRDVKGYNHAVSNLWFVFSVLLELLGVPLLFLEQNSPYFLFVSILSMFLVIGLILVYMKIEAKYR